MVVVKVTEFSSPTQNLMHILLSKIGSGRNALLPTAKTVAMALALIVVTVATVATVATVMAVLAIALVVARGCHRDVETQHQGLLHQKN